MIAAADASIAVVRNARARRLRLSVDPRDGRVRLTIPPRASQKQALAWAETQRDWIAAQRAKLPEARPITPGACLPFGDGTLTIVWPASAVRAPRREGSQLLCGGPRDGLERRVLRWLRDESLRLLREDTMAMAAHAGVTIARVGVGDARTRWGSCAASGAVRYSWRLIFAPVWVRRAVVAHEVAHRVHMNHGRAFHALAARLFGADPEPAHRWLRANGAALHWIGRE